MTAAVIGLVVLALVMVLGLLAAGTVDGVTALLFVLILVLGAVSIRVARKSEVGAVEPLRCPNCEGLNSPNAPYCKHCKTSFGREVT